MSELLLTYIIPVYNTERYIDRCLMSIVNQGLADDTYEVLVVDDGSTDGTRDLLRNELKSKIGEGVVVLLSEVEGKVNVVVSATDSAIAKGAHAGNLIKEVAKCVGGGGGGRPNMAQAGGKDPSGITSAIEKAKEILGTQIKN